MSLEHVNMFVEDIERKTKFLLTALPEWSIRGEDLYALPFFLPGSYSSLSVVLWSTHLVRRVVVGSQPLNRVRRTGDLTTTMRRGGISAPTGSCTCAVSLVPAALSLASSD
jgi:hypothetical protein